MGDDRDRKLFEEALASMSPKELYRGKYGGDEAPGRSAETSAPTPPEELERLREQIEMERAFAGISRLDQGKYYAPAPREDAETPADALRAEFEAALAPPPPSAPEPPPRPTLAQSAPLDVHTYNMRGMAPERAVGKLGLFIDLAQKDGHALVRLRIGSNAPLLKAVRAWFEGPGLIYVDEVEVAQEHEDAMIFARIRRKQHP